MILNSDLIKLFYIPLIQSTASWTAVYCKALMPRTKNFWCMTLIRCSTLQCGQPQPPINIRQLVTKHWQVYVTITLRSYVLTELHDWRRAGVSANAEIRIKNAGVLSFRSRLNFALHSAACTCHCDDKLLKIIGTVVLYYSLAALCYDQKT